MTQLTPGTTPIDLDLFGQRERDTLPVPPLRLRRVRLHGVGPDGARFDPLDLDFTTSHGAASRVLLSLTNTGGKSTLITLVSSLIVPAARAQVGGKNLGDYVLTGDTSHIVCEWEDASTSTRTVTGTVMEWKDGRRQPGHRQRSLSNMHRVWYLFRTATGQPGIDDLPFIIDGRRASFTRYIASLTQIMAQRPAAQWVVAQTQQDWTLTLEQRTSIDPVLFSYQMRMNDAEAGAEKLLASFDSSDNVVRFFVGALNDDREIAGFTDRLAPYAELAMRRPYLEALSGFGAAIAPLVELIAQRADIIDDAVATALRNRVTGGEHAAALRNRVQADEHTLNELSDKVDESAREAGAARREYGQISDIRLQLQLEQARADLDAASRELAYRSAEATAAVQESNAWEAVDPIIEVDTAEQECNSARTAYEAADAGLGPLRQAVTEAAAALAGRLDALITEAAEVADSADIASAEAENARAKAVDRQTAAERAEETSRRELTSIETLIRSSDAAATIAIDDGWLHIGESPERCVNRWRNAETAAAQDATAHQIRAENAEASFDKQVIAITAVDQDLIILRETSARDSDRLSSYDDDLVRLAVDESVVALIGGPPQTAADIGRAAELAAQAARDADIRAAEHERQAREARQELAHLDASGTAATGDDVLLVLQTLINAGIGASTGLEWIERNVVQADQRRAFIAGHPDVAGGVVVADASRFVAAIEQLDAANLHTRTPVVVTTAAATTRAPLDDDRQYVVVPHRATWDRQWAADMRTEFVTTSEQQGIKATDATDAAARYRTAVATCRDFDTRWQSSQRAELVSADEASTRAVADAINERDRLVRVRDEFRAGAKTARVHAETARNEAIAAGIHAGAAELLVVEATKAAEAAAGRPAIERSLAASQKAVTAAKVDQQTETGRWQHGMRTAVRARADQETWKRRRLEIVVKIAAPDPGGNLEVITSAWTSLRDELAAAEQGLIEAEFLRRAERRLTQARERLDRFQQIIRDRARELAASTAASSRESRLGAQEQARRAKDAAEKRRLQAEHAHEVAQAAVATASPATGDRQNYVDFSNVPQWRPDGPGDIPAVLERLEIHNTELLSRRERAERAEREAQELHDVIVADINAFTDTIGMWTFETVPTTRRYGGGRDTARDEMRTHVKTQRDADAAERIARDALQEAVTALRATANESRWRDMDAPAVVRVRSLPDADLVAEAALLGRRIRAMAESAGGDLVSLDIHRTILRDELLSLCREQRRLLREVSRASRLPAGLGELSDNAAIKIRFEEASDDEASAHIAQRIDSWALEIAANPKRASSADVRVRWLADAVRDTVTDRARAGAWSIEILKPRIDGRVMYCPPDRIPHEFSGGQVLTLAVLVYCALSGVRSAHRTGGARPPGTLILDNPFGAASNETLIEMQHRLAAHTGLQLVCATGLNDAGVDAAFTGPASVIVKLRNDGDVRRNLSFLRLRARTVDGLDIAAAITAGRRPDAPQNWLDATAYEIR